MNIKPILLSLALGAAVTAQAAADKVWIQAAIIAILQTGLEDHIQQLDILLQITGFMTLI